MKAAWDHTAQLSAIFVHMLSSQPGIIDPAEFHMYPDKRKTRFEDAVAQVTQGRPEPKTTEEIEARWEEITCLLDQ